MENELKSEHRLRSLNFDRIDEKDYDAADPRQAFIRDSQALARGKSMSDVRKMHTDALKLDDLSPRERFMLYSQWLADGESARDIESDRPQSRFPKSDTRMDAQRTDLAGRLLMFDPKCDENEKEDPRSELIRKMAAMRKSGR